MKRSTLAATMAALAGFALAGRQHGSDGEEKTVNYLRTQFQRLGLEPGNNGSYFQTVPMIETHTDPSKTSVRIDVAGKPHVMRFGDDMVIGSRTGAADVHVGNAPMVFVGYGVNAPEANWNDYAGVDVKNKIVVMLINDPGFHNGDESLFEGRRMTYYGRWTYKFEEAARQGAAGAIIIHDTFPAAYGWQVVNSSWTGSQDYVASANNAMDQTKANGWVQKPVAQAVLKASGQDL